MQEGLLALSQPLPFKILELLHLALSQKRIRQNFVSYIIYPTLMALQCMILFQRFILQ